MILDGDVRLQHIEDGGDIEFVAGQPAMDQGLGTAVYISLFSGSDWWGNVVSERDEKLESQLESLYERHLDNRTRLDAEEYCRKGLDWLKRAGIAKDIEVEASLPAVGWIGLHVLITQPSGAETNLRYQVNWAAQRVAMGV